MFHVTRRTAALAVVGLLLLFAGCGEDEPESGSAPATTLQETNDSSLDSAPEGAERPKRRQAEDRNAGDPEIPGQVQQRREELDIRPGADNSLQTFGTEPGGEEHSEVAGAMRDYLSAVARDDFVAACRDFSKSLRVSNEDLVNRFRRRQGRPPVSGCSDLGADLRRLSEGSGLSGEAGDVLNGEVLRVGIEVETGQTIVIVRLEDGELIHFPMVSEGGRWKAYSIAPKPVRAG